MGGWPADTSFVGAGAGGVSVRDTGTPGFWRVPGSGTPAKPEEAVTPHADAIAAAVARRLTVPRGPTRTASFSLGLTGGYNNIPFAVTSGALNSKITLPVLAGPGTIKSFDFNGQFNPTAASYGVLQLFDNDVNAPLLRSIPIVLSVAAASVIPILFSVAGPLSIPFLQGILAIWNPIAGGAFGSSVITMNIDFDSIPVGEKMEFSQ